VVAGVKSKVFRIYLYASLVAILAVFVASLFMLESPSVTRNRKLDQMIINDFGSLENNINTYYNQNDKLPGNLDIIKN